MYRKSWFLVVVLCQVLGMIGLAFGEQDQVERQITKVYVSYEELRGILDGDPGGVFLPYGEFEALWRAAQGAPGRVGAAPGTYMISSARYVGEVEGELGRLNGELTIDVLGDGWVTIPLALGETGVAEVRFLEGVEAGGEPLLKVDNGRYFMYVKGKGRYVLSVDFVRQLESRGGLNVLSFGLPQTAITSLELLIPEENLSVDVAPLLAATTTQVERGQGKATRLQAFLGAAESVSMSWKPRSEAAEELEAVVTCEQMQHVHVAEALISYEVRFDYTIQRGGVEAFEVRLPGLFRVTEVEGASIAKWDVAPTGVEAGQVLSVQLFSAAKEKYGLRVKMERFLQEEQGEVSLEPITTESVIRRSGLIAVTHSMRRVVYLRDLESLARVDIARLGEDLRNQSGVSAYRFISDDYGGNLVIETAEPRILVNQLWMLGVDGDQQQLRGKLSYTVERAGVFELKMRIPEPWVIERVGPAGLVDDYQVGVVDGERELQVLLKKEQTGQFELDLVARAARDAGDEVLDFELPLPEEGGLQLHQGQLMLYVAEQLRAEVDQVRQMQAIPMQRGVRWVDIAGLAPVMAFEFRGVDREQGAGVSFRIAVKPTQVSAVVHRRVNIQPGSVEQEANVDYTVRYAPIDTFYLMMPEALADEGVEISGRDIKEKPRIAELPEDQRGQAMGGEVTWAYYKIVLQSKVMGGYRLTVSTRRGFQVDQTGTGSEVEVVPILAAGALSDQSGHIAIIKADTLAIGAPVMDNLTPGDAGSAIDLPYEPHRRSASLAFKYTTPPYELVLPVRVQKEATVFTTMVSGVVIEQVLARDGMLNTHASYLLATSRGDRLSLTLPKEAQLTAVLLNGGEIPMEMGEGEDERIVRLPPSAGQVSKFVLEISYGLRDAKASSLIVPALPEDIPVQQTLWSLWVPEDYHLLGFDRTFSQLNGPACQNMIETLNQNQPSRVMFKLPHQGRQLNFVRQGAPGELSVSMMGKASFSLLIWVLILGAGGAMMTLGGYHRLLLILGAGFLLGLMHLYLPLFVWQLVETGVFAVGIVVVLWLGQWVFLDLPKLLEARAPKLQSESKALTEPVVETESVKTKKKAKRIDTGKDKE